MIRCKRCDLEFCWLCFDDADHHSEDTCVEVAAATVLSQFIAIVLVCVKVAALLVTSGPLSNWSDALLGMTLAEVMHYAAASTAVVALWSYTGWQLLWGQRREWQRKVVGVAAAMWLLSDWSSLAFQIAIGVPLGLVSILLALAASLVFLGLAAVAAMAYTAVLLETFFAVYVEPVAMGGLVVLGFYIVLRRRQ